MNRNIVVKVKATEEERETIKRRANKAGYKNVSAYIRKMALDGMNVIVSVDADIKETVRLMSTATNNINQIAKKANETNSVYENDVNQLRKEVTEIRDRAAMLEVNVYGRLKQQSEKIAQMIQKSGM